MRSLLFLLPVLTLAASAQPLSTPDNMVVAAFPYLQPSVQQNLSTTVRPGSDPLEIESSGSERTVGYRLYYWEVTSDGFWSGIVSEDAISYTRIDPQFVYWFGSCAIVECRDDLVTTDASGREFETGLVRGST